MPSWLTKLVPSTLKNRLFLAFILFILVPFFTISALNFRNMEVLLREQVSTQNLEQMRGMSRSFEELLSVAKKTFYLIEQDNTAKAILQNPLFGDSYEVFNQWTMMESKLKAINNSLFISNSYVYYTLLDRFGNAYSSYSPVAPLRHKELMSSNWAIGSLQGDTYGQWFLEPNYTQAGSSARRPLISTARAFRNVENDAYAVAKISVDFDSWFRNANPVNGNNETYTLLSEQLVPVAQTGENRQLDPVIKELEAYQRPNGSLQVDDYFYTYIRIAGLNWYMVKSIPTEVMFSRINALQRTFYFTSFGVAILFIGITFLIASTMTRPLQQLRKKMTQIVQSNLKVRLPEEQYMGEIQTFVQGFNSMVNDMDELIHKLKVEERQKEAMRFQMLLSQMNPHFLLNTLNTVKWMSMDTQQQQQIPQVCESLGRLLTVGMRLDVDLIHWEQEIELVDSYIYIQQHRYDRQFEVRYEYDDELRFALVPKLCLQPLVENCIYHGFAGMDTQGIITIRASIIEESLLQIEVHDNGVGMRSAAQAGSVRKSGGNGIALRNVEERLQLLFREKAAIAFPETDRGTLVTISIPLLISAPYQEEGTFDVDRTARGR
jgi:two-component system, sensor histidine kinase YesM